MNEMAQDAFFSGVYIGITFLFPIALWALVCAIMNRSIS
jgi:hypothetical protein